MRWDLEVLNPLFLSLKCLAYHPETQITDYTV